MSTVWKYPLEITDEQTIKLPAAAVTLFVGLQRGSLCLWALVDPDNELTERKFRIAGTGHPIDYHHHDLEFIGTVLMHGDTLVWHVFEVTP